MIDWGAIWNAINSNVVALIFAAIIGVIGAFALERFSKWREESTQRKGLALMLGYEIAQMKAIASASAKRNRAILEDYRKQVGAGKRGFLVLTDMDLSRAVYDKPTTNLSLFPPELIPDITDLYRRVELCNHVKRLANDVSAKGNNLMPTFLITQTDPNVNRELDRAATQFIGYLEIFLSNLESLSNMCASTVEGLSKIAKIDESKVYAVSMASPDAPQTFTTKDGTVP